MIIPIALALSTAVSWSAAGVILKSVSTKYGSMAATLMIAAGNLVLLSIVLLFIGGFSLSAYSMLLSLLGGVLTAIGYLLFYTSLEREQASNTFATIEIQVVLLALYGILALHEGITIIGAGGIALILLGVFMVSFEKGRRFNKGLLPAMAANVFWAFGWIALVYPIAHSKTSLLPVWISFIAVITIVSIVMFSSKKRTGGLARMGAGGAVTGLGAGLLSGTGNALYSMLISFKQLVFGTVLSNTSPALVAVFAHFAYHDRLTMLQIAGIVFVVAGGLILGAY